MNGEQVFQRVITQIFNPLYQLIFGLAFLYFFYGIVVFMLNRNDPEKMNTGKQHLMYGTIGLFIILSIGGFLKLMNDLFGGFFTF